MLIKYIGKCVNIYFIMKIKFSFKNNIFQCHFTAKLLENVVSSWAEK